jgi:hypothetical protein
MIAVPIALFLIFIWLHWEPRLNRFVTSNYADFD